MMHELQIHTNMATYGAIIEPTLAHIDDVPKPTVLRIVGKISAASKYMILNDADIANLPTLVKSNNHTRPSGINIVVYIFTRHIFVVSSNNTIVQQ